jgi:hypothetical protein
MTDQEKWVEALARLTRKTLEGEIRWESIPSTQIEPQITRVDKAFETTFRDQRIRAFHMRTSSSTLSAFFGRPSDQFIIDFLDASGKPAYRPPFLDGAKDLFSAIEDQAAPAGQFLEVLLHD